MTWLFDLSAVFILAAAGGFIIHRLRMPLLVAYLAVGIGIGRFFPALTNREPIFSLLAQIGVVAMLFIIGMQLDLRRMRELGKSVILVGLLQLCVTTLFGWLIGMAFHFSWMTSLFIASCLAMGSTLVVTKMLGEMHDLGKLYGRLSLGILLLQDLFAAIALFFLASRQHESAALPASAAAWVGWGLLTIGMILIMRRIAMAILPSVARSQELLLLFTVAWGLGFAAWFTLFGASAELGALMAGVLLASTPYRFEIAAKLRPLRDLFLVLFFLLLGSSINGNPLAALTGPLFVLLVFVVFAKPLIVYVLLIGSSYAKRASFLAALTQGHVSEFSLLLAALASKSGMIAPEIATLLIVVGMISILFSSVAILHGSSVFDAFSPILDFFSKERKAEQRETRESFDILLFGCHRTGADLLRAFAASGRSCLVVDFDPERIAELAECRWPCRYGDAEDPEFLDELPWKRTRMLVTSIPDPDVNALLLETAKKKNPSCLRLVVAHRAKDAMAYYEAGASYVILPHDLGGMHATSLLDKHGFRKSGFARERAAHLDALHARLERERLETSPLSGEEPIAYT